MSDYSNIERIKRKIIYGVYCIAMLSFLFFNSPWSSQVTKRRKKAKTKAYSKRTYHKRYRRYGKQKYPHTAGKRKDRSMRRIRYTRNNQPYIILANGRARFISKKSAKTSRKRRGGRY